MPKLSLFARLQTIFDLHRGDILDGGHDGNINIRFVELPDFAQLRRGSVRRTVQWYEVSLPNGTTARVHRVLPNAASQGDVRTILQFLAQHE